MRPGLLAALLCLPLTTAAAQTHLVVISGLGGETRYRERFHEWAVTLLDAATKTHGIPEGNTIYLAERPALAPQRIHDRSTKANVERVLREVGEQAGTASQVFIVLIGHGSARDGVPKLNLPGPDLTAHDLAAALSGYRTSTLVVVNLASASGDFIPILSGPNRTVITATKSGRECNETRFGTYFVQSIATDAGDVDHDGHVSLLEAFTYARTEVARSYEQEGTLLTEHALLDDNGDKVGSHEPDPSGADGAIARTLVFGGPSAARRGDPSGAQDPVLATLSRTKQSLERAIAALQQEKQRMAPDEYEQRLEDLLLQLASTNRKIREREEQIP